MKIFLISPVRRVSKRERKEIEKYVAKLESQGHKVHWPERDTNQNDKIGLRICLDNKKAIEWADEIHIWWQWTKRRKSTGSLFDFGMAFALNKPIVLANPNEVEPTPEKSFNNVLLALHAKSITVVDETQCSILGEFLKTVDLPSAQEEIMRYQIPDRIMSNLYFAVVAICHQTTPHKGPALQGYVDGKLRRGWDYLRKKWIRAAEQNPTLVSPGSLANITAQDIEQILFDARLGSTIFDSQGRASLLNDIGQKMIELGINDVWSLYELSHGSLLSQEQPGLIELLSQFAAYKADPVKKKLFFFLSLMFNHGFWAYTDPENLGTPVDYHEVRGHLRYGTVKIVSDQLRDKILTGQEVTSDEDTLIRRAVFDAIMLVSRISGRTPNDLHYFFWNIFRNCCRRDETHCNACGQHPSLPERYQALSPEKCIFAATCKNAGSEAKLTDHIVNTDLY